MNRQVQTIFLILALILAGCASNMQMSEALIFSDHFDGDMSEPHLAFGGDISANYQPKIQPYADHKFGRDSFNTVKYLQLKPGFSLGIGLIMDKLAVGTSLSLPNVVGADVAFKPSPDFLVSGNVTTAKSFGASLLMRFSETYAVGPFYRVDRFEGWQHAFLNGDGFFKHTFHSSAIGFRVLKATSDSFDRRMGFYFGGLGYNKTLRAFMIFGGLTGVNIFF